MACGPGWLKRWWIASVLRVTAIGQPIGSMWVKPRGAVVKISIIDGMGFHQSESCFILCARRHDNVFGTRMLRLPQRPFLPNPNAENATSYQNGGVHQPHLELLEMDRRSSIS
jgi:hypothetical protein